MPLPNHKWHEQGPRETVHARTRSYATRYQLQFFETPGLNPKLLDPVEVQALVRAKFLPYWPTDQLALLREISCRQQANARRFWDVNVSWSTEDGDGAASEENPLLAPVSRAITFTDGTKLVGVDVAGNALVTTAGEPFDLVEVPDGRARLDLSWVTLSMPPTTLMAYRNATNGDFFYGAAANSFRVADLASEERHNQQGQVYYLNRAALEYDPEGTKLRLANQGFYLRNDDDPTKPKRIMAAVEKFDDDGESFDPKQFDYEPKETPSLINEAGDEVLPPGSSPIILEFDVLPALSFGGFFP